MGELAIFTDDTDFIIAESANEAHKIHATMCGEEYASPVEQWEQYAPNSGQFTIRESGPNGEDQTKPISQWIDERGRGWLASTDG